MNRRMVKGQQNAMALHLDRHLVQLSSAHMPDGGGWMGQGGWTISKVGGGDDARVLSLCFAPSIQFPTDEGSEAPVRRG